MADAAIVQYKWADNGGGSTSVGVTFDAPITPGNVILVMIVNRLNANPSMTTGGFSSFAGSVYVGAANDLKHSNFFVKTATAGLTALSFSLSSSARAQMFAVEVSGAADPSVAGNRHNTGQIVPAGQANVARSQFPAVGWAYFGVVSQANSNSLAGSSPTPNPADFGGIQSGGGSATTKLKTGSGMGISVWSAGTEFQAMAVDTAEHGAASIGIAPLADTPKSGADSGSISATETSSIVITESKSAADSGNLTSTESGSSALYVPPPIPQLVHGRVYRGDATVTSDSLAVVEGDLMVMFAKAQFFIVNETETMTPSSTATGETWSTVTFDPTARVFFAVAPATESVTFSIASNPTPTHALMGIAIIRGWNTDKTLPLPVEYATGQGGSSGSAAVTSLLNIPANSLSVSHLSAVRTISGSGVIPTTTIGSPVTSDTITNDDTYKSLLASKEFSQGVSQHDIGIDSTDDTAFLYSFSLFVDGVASANTPISGSDSGSISATETADVVISETEATKSGSDTGSFSAVEASSLFKTIMASDSGNITGLDSSSVDISSSFVNVSGSDGGSLSTGKVTTESFATLPSDITINGSVSLDSSTGQPSPSLRTDGGGASWIGNADRWYADGDFDFYADFIHNPGGSTDREIHNFAFWMNAGDGFAFRSQTGAIDGGFLVITNGSHTFVGGNTNFVTPANTWCQVHISVRGFTATATITRKSDSVVLVSDTKDLSALGKPANGYFGQHPDGAGTTDGTRIDNIFITSGGGEVSSLLISDANTASDTGSFSATETSSIASTQTRTDTGNLTATETRSIASTQTRTDAGNLTATETRAIAASSTRSDSGTLSATEASAIVVSAAITSADSGSLTSTESTSGSVTATASDSGNLTVVEALSLLAVRPGTDGGTFTLVESGSVLLSGSVDKTSTDSGTISAAESGQIASTLSRSDAGSITAVESSALVKNVTGSDSGSLSATESRIVASSSSRSDSGALSVTESSSLFKTLSASDSGTLSATETGGVFFARPGTDSGTLSALESSSIAQSGTIEASSADSGSISGLESRTISVVVSGADSGTLSATESTQAFKQIAVSDSGTLSAVDSSAAFKTISASDSGSLTVAESGISFANRPGADSGILSTTEASSIIVSGTITKSSSDSGSLSALETRTSAITVSRTDSGSLTATESTLAFVTQSASDIGELSATESVVIYDPAAGGVPASLWNGTVMVSGLLRVWNGVMFVTPIVRRWNGSAFVEIQI